MTIDRMMREACERFAEQSALREKIAGRWLATRYQELWQKVDGIASGLNQRDFKPGDHAAIVAASSPRWVAAYIGILAAGGVAVPIDKELKSNELRHILANSEARVLFLEEHYLEPILELQTNFPHLEQIVLLDDRRPALDNPLNELVDAWQDLVERQHLPREETSRLESLANRALALLRRQSGGEDTSVADIFSPVRKNLQRWIQKERLHNLASFVSDQDYPQSARKATDTAIILYTSGTTGKSKGAMLSHGNVVSNIEAAATHFGLDHGITTLSFLPINHVFEQVCGILLPLHLGGTVTFAESIKKLGENLAEIRPSFLLGVPAVYRLLLDRIHKNINSKTFSRLLFANPLTRSVVAGKVRAKVGAETKFVSGGAALDPAVAAGFAALGLQLYQGYGITETAPVIAAESPFDRRPGTVGKPIPGVEIEIAWPNSEGVGEILAKGPNVMQGYFKNPLATEEVLKDGWYHSGDLGRIDEDGYLHICGRVKNLIVTPNGKNVYPEEVENELLNSPYIAEVMVYGHKLSSTAEEVYAVIFPDQEQLDNYQRHRGKGPLREKEIEDILRQEVLAAGKTLADYKRVKKFTLRYEEFPKTTTRKIKRYVVEPDISTSAT